MNQENWIKVSDKMPKSLELIICAGRNQYGKWRTLRAFFVHRYTVEDNDSEYEATEYNEEKDRYYLKEGWYEMNEFEDVHWMVTFPITHWMPMPKHPTS